MDWIGSISQFSKDFIGNYNEDIDEEYFGEVEVQFPKKFHDLY